MTDARGTIRLAVLNGPNLAHLGRREPTIYGSATLTDLQEKAKRWRESGTDRPVTLEFAQMDGEGELIGWLWQARDRLDGVVFNPGAYAHTSYALRDAIAGCGLPVVEVHISNIYAREGFRRRSVTAPACVAVVTGLGLDGYLYALDALYHRVSKDD